MAARKTPAAGSKSDKLWRDAVMRAVKRRAEDVAGKPQKLERLADKVVELGLEGDMGAIKEIGDRLDGRPAQSVVGEDGGPLQIVVVTGIDRDEPDSR